MENEWDEAVGIFKNRHEKLIESILENIDTAAKACGYQTGTIQDTTDEEFTWELIVHVEEVPAEEVGTMHVTDLLVELRLCESEVAGDGEAGVNLELKFLTNDARVLERVAPGNYTEECWVPLKDKLFKERVDLIDRDGPYLLEQAVEAMLTEQEKDEKRGLYEISGDS